MAVIVGNDLGDHYITPMYYDDADAQIVSQITIPSISISKNVYESFANILLDNTEEDTPITIRLDSIGEIDIDNTSSVSF